MLHRISCKEHRLTQLTVPLPANQPPNPTPIPKTRHLHHPTPTPPHLKILQALASGLAIALPTVAMWEVFQVLLSTMMVRLAMAVVW